jgi:hypothetical protein
MTKEAQKMPEPLTAVWRDWGFGLNLRIDLCLEKFVFDRKIPHLSSPTSPSVRTLIA